MKTLVFILLLACAAYSEGITMIVNYRMICLFRPDDPNIKYSLGDMSRDNCETREEPSRFHIDDRFTRIIHTTTNMESVYFIRHKSLDRKNNLMQINVTSNAGNKYLVIIHYNENKITFMSPTIGSEISYIVTYTITSSH